MCYFDIVVHVGPAVKVNVSGNETTYGCQHSTKYFLRYGILKNLVQLHLFSDFRDKKMESIRLEPNLSIPDVFDLSYYGNVVTSVFALESVMGKLQPICVYNVEDL